MLQLLDNPANCTRMTRPHGRASGRIYAPLIDAMVFGLLLTPRLIAAVTNSPAMSIDDSSIGAVAWGAPDNATVADGAFAGVTMDPGAVSHYLMATGFNFSLPTNAVVDGITASLLRKA